MSDVAPAGAGTRRVSWTKRSVDVLVAALTGVLAIPVVGVLALFILVETRSNPIFSQERVGQHGRRFRMFKLRTMTVDTPERATHEVSAGSVTRLGRVLRASKLDELPQFWNVLRGDMSLVGPRPCLPSQSALIAERERRGVDALRPGITGVSQLRGLDMSDPGKLAQTDATYLTLQSLGFDLRLIVATALGGGFGDRIRSVSEMAEEH